MFLCLLSNTSASSPAKVSLLPSSSSLGISPALVLLFVSLSNTSQSSPAKVSLLPSSPSFGISPASFLSFGSLSSTSQSSPAKVSFVPSSSFGNSPDFVLCLGLLSSTSKSSSATLRVSPLPSLFGIFATLFLGMGFLETICLFSVLFSRSLYSKKNSLNLSFSPLVTTVLLASIPSFPKPLLKGDFFMFCITSFFALFSFIDQSIWLIFLNFTFIWSIFFSSFSNSLSLSSTAPGHLFFFTLSNFFFVPFISFRSFFCSFFFLSSPFSMRVLFFASSSFNLVNSFRICILKRKKNWYYKNMQ